MIIFIKIFKRLNSFFKIIIWKLLYFNKVKIGINTVFYPKTHMTIDGGKVTIGKKCFFNNNCSINSRKNIEIGDYVIVGENVCFYDHNHKFRNKEMLIKKQGFSDKIIKIGNNCWIGSNVTILAGTVIEDNVIIGAGCTIKGNIKENTIVKNYMNYIMEEY